MSRQLSLISEVDDGVNSGDQAALGQYMTPRWAAYRIIEQFFGDLGMHDHVLERACGTGAWLEAIPPMVSARGIEIDPTLAAIARERTGREIDVGDFQTIAIDREPTVIISNPPFAAKTIAGFLKRTAALLAPGARAGFLLPVHSLSFARSTLALLAPFEVQIDLVPRDLYPRLHFPMLFARLTRAKTTQLVGFVLL